MSDKQVKVAVIYYSMTGTNSQMARWAQEAAEATGADVRLRKIEDNRTPNNPAWEAEVERSKAVENATSDDLLWADVLVFNFPTRFGGPAAEFKQFIDRQGGLWAQGQLIDKVVTASTSAGNAHGGQEQALMMLTTSMAHWGAIPVFPGYTDDSIFAAGGNPYGASVTVGDGSQPIPETIKAALVHQVKRAIKIGEKLHG